MIALEQLIEADTIETLKVYMFKRPNLAFYVHKNMYLNYMPAFVANCVKVTLSKIESFFKCTLQSVACCFNIHT